MVKYLFFVFCFCMKGLVKDYTQTHAYTRSVMDVNDFYSSVSLAGLYDLIFNYASGGRRGFETSNLLAGTTFRAEKDTGKKCRVPAAKLSN